MSLKALEQLFENLDGLWSWEVEEGLCHFCEAGWNQGTETLGLENERG